MHRASGVGGKQVLARGVRLSSHPSRTNAVSLLDRAWRRSQTHLAGNRARSHSPSALFSPAPCSAGCTACLCCVSSRRRNSVRAMRAAENGEERAWTPPPSALWVVLLALRRLYLKLAWWIAERIVDPWMVMWEEGYKVRLAWRGAVGDGGTRGAAVWMHSTILCARESFAAFV